MQQAFLEGVEDVVKKLDELHPKKQRFQYRKIARNAGKVLQAEIQENIEEGGRGKMVIRKGGRGTFYEAGSFHEKWRTMVHQPSEYEVEAMIYTKVPYALAVEFGHMNVRTGDYIQGKGEARRAFDQSGERIFKLVVDQVSEDLTKIATRLNRKKRRR